MFVFVRAPLPDPLPDRVTISWSSPCDLSEGKEMLLLRGTMVKIGPIHRVHTKTYILAYFVSKYLVLFTVVPRNSIYL